MYFLTELKEGLGISFAAIRANKMRSVLTTLGIVIGIVSVTAMAAAIDGLNQAFDRSAKAFGTDVMYVEKWPWISNEDWSTMRNRRDIKLEYADKIERQATLINAVAPVAITRMKVHIGNNAMDGAFVTGTTATYNSASGNTELDGRFFSPEEAAGGRPVCVIGATVAETLFPNSDPIGQTIRVSGFPYTVLGVYEKQGGLFGQFTSDTRVFVPMHSFQSNFGSRHYVSINMRVADVQNMDEAKLEVEGIMRQIRGLPPGKPNDFAINQQEMLSTTFGGFTLVVGIVGIIITGMSLLVGGIGIMNIMFVSVTERTREIGIRKAIGAKRRTILLQFLTEAAALCLIGGIIGLLIASVLVLIVNKTTEFQTTMPLPVVVVALLFSLVVGVFFGFLPAYRASKMDPVEALRYE
jgi:putative ABC transport system permease protein